MQLRKLNAPVPDSNPFFFFVRTDCSLYLSALAPERRRFCANSRRIPRQPKKAFAHPARLG
jgi:hypothetical protein